MALDRERIGKIVLIAVVAVVGIICVWMFYLGPRIKMIAGGKRKLAELKEQYSEVQNIIKRAESSKTNLENLRGKLTRFDKDIPPETMDEWILNKVHKICRDVNIRYEHWRPQETEEFKDKVIAKSYCLKKVKLDITSDYHTLGKFLNQIENSSHFIRVDELMINDSSVPDRQQIQFSINYVARREQ